jgi:4-amino-4-deoxy-L-arabinose transferase-like glycosyltransferase
VSDRRHVGALPTWGVAALILAWLAATAWARPLMLPDEGRYVGVAWEMMRSGDWLTPTLDGLPFFHKPPLFYWITAGAMSLLGLHEAAGRAAPLLGAWAGALALYLLVRRWWGEAAARLGLLALLVQPLWYVGGQFANLDMLVAGCITATLAAAAHAALCLEHDQPHRRVLALAYALAALGVLAKGLIGGVLPVLVLLAWLVPRRRWRVLRGLVWWPGLLVFVALAAPWFVAMQWRYPDFLDYFFVVQHFKRFAAGGFNNAQPFWFYPAVLALLSLPWLPWLLKRRPLADPERGPLRLLMLVWAAVVVLFFSLPSSKLVGYVLPAVPPLAVLMADGLQRAGWPTTRAWRWGWASVAVSALVGIGAVVTLALRPLESSRELAAALRAAGGAAEPVVLLEGYAYDLPFYARLGAPMVVVDDWSSPALQERDDWRKELADAGRFAPAAAAATLVEPAALPRTLCRAPVHWFVGAASVAPRYAFLAQARAVHTGPKATLWRLETANATSLPCPQRPSAGSADR